MTNLFTKDNNAVERHSYSNDIQYEGRDSIVSMEIDGDNKKNSLLG